MLNTQQAYEQEIKSLKARISAMEGAAQQAQSAPAPIHTAAAPGHIPVQVGLSGLFTAGGSSVDNAALEGLQAGAHDPSRLLPAAAVVTDPLCHGGDVLCDADDRRRGGDLDPVARRNAAARASLFEAR